MVQESSGACVYRTQDCEPIAQYILQKRFELYLLIVTTSDYEPLNTEKKSEEKLMTVV